jgi:nicotinamide-nucleotide amidase
MKVEIITIGDEILFGQTVDTNSAWLAKKLNEIGMEIARITSIADTREAILEALDQTKGRAAAVLMTGGLGPTSDDITKPTLCEFFNTTLEMNHDVLGRIEAFFDKVKRPMLDVNRKQAELPRDADMLINVRGTAQGMWFEKEDQVFISMPGVPYEMRSIMRDGGLDRLKSRFNPSTIVHRTVLTQGIGESFLAEIVADWEQKIHDTEGLSLAYLPSPGLVKVRVTGRGGDRASMEAKVDAFAAELKTLVPKHVFGDDEEKLEEVVGELLKNRNMTLSTAESCTGGAIAQMLTSVPGSSSYFLGSVVSYSNEVKQNMLGVSEQDLQNHGAVSKEVVEAMAAGIQSRTGSDYALATSGIAGPDGGSEEKPVGTVWIAVAGPKTLKSKQFSFGTGRKRNIRKSALTALNWLRKEIIEADFD